MAGKSEQSALRGKWSNRIAQATRDYQKLHESGKKVVDQYRIEQQSSTQQDKYNILYSITETIKPSMYSQTPKPEVKRRHIDRTDPMAIGASMLLESAVQYTIEEQDFDETMRAAVEDLLLPGLGQVWLRYVPTMKTVAETDDTGAPKADDKGDPITRQEVVYEHVAMEYVYWKDFLTSRARCWSEVWWVGRRIYLNKQDMLDQGVDPLVVAKVKFEDTSSKAIDEETRPNESQAAVWEIWDKRARKVIWYTDAYPDDLLKEAPDFLKLENFFPCPRPMRAVTTNNKFVPRPYFSQYQAQADELNDITHRIRRLVKALRVVGIYDASVPQLQNLLTGNENKMVQVDGWATVQEKGGLKGTVDFLPISEVATVLLQLYDARERVKAEIYEITGWSDIIRGVSKASETLGAQQLKADWAGARLKLLQKDVQRFVRDIFRIAGEIVSEHFTVQMLLLMSGISQTDIQANPQIADVFKQVVQLLRSEKERCALIGVESDSTLLPDEANDRKDRMEFVGAAGAFLQQAIPAAQQFPQLGAVLGEILMFAVRSFRSARSLEQTFEQFRQQLTATPPQQPNKGGDQGAGKTEAATITAQVKTQDIQVKDKLGTEANRIAQEANQSDAVLEHNKETNRHNEKMRELAIREREASIKEHELGIKEQTAVLDQIGKGQGRVQAAQEHEDDRADDHHARAQESSDKAADRAAAASGGESA